MDLIPNSTFRIIERDTSHKGPLPGVYRVLLDDRASGLICTVLIYLKDDIVQRPQTGRKRKKDSELRRPRKKSPRPLVGRPLWMHRSDLERMEEKGTLIQVTVERQMVLKPAEQQKSSGEKVGKTATEIEHEDRITKMALFLDLVHLQESLLMHKGLGGIVKDTIEKHGVSRYFVYKHWSALCKWGMHESSLYPHRANCGAPGVARPCDPPANGMPARKKAGRKTLEQRIVRPHGTTLANQQLGMTKDWTARILAADQQIATPKPKMPDRVKIIMASAFVSKILDVGSTVQYVMPERGTYPNNRQIRRVLERDRSKLQKLIEKTTLRHFRSQLRGLNARNWKGVSGPGHTWTIDSTIGDIYLRSSINRAWIVGRPIVYILVDVWSTAVVGFYVCLTGPSWDTAKVALFNACAGQALVQEIYDYVPMANIFPSPSLCYRLICDRGEYLSKGQRSTAFKLDYDVAFTPPYRGDLKGLVEVLHRIVKDKQYFFIPGAMDFRREELELRKVDPSKCTMTIHEYSQYLFETFTDYNFTADRSDRVSAEMRAAGVFPSPAGLWRWGHEMGVGFRKETHQDELIRELLPANSARVRSKDVWYGGNAYSSEEMQRLEWTAQAKNFGSWEIPINHHPGALHSIWTPNDDAKGLMRLQLSAESKASRQTTFEEWADVLALETMARPGESHDRLEFSLRSFQRLNQLREQSQELTRAAMARASGSAPSMTEARRMEASKQHPTHSEPQRTSQRSEEPEEAVRAHLAMMAELYGSSSAKG
jgi:hypothetical protein